MLFKLNIMVQFQLLMAQRWKKWIYVAIRRNKWCRKPWNEPLLLFTGHPEQNVAPVLRVKSSLVFQTQLWSMKTLPFSPLFIATKAGTAVSCCRARICQVSFRLALPLTKEACCFFLFSNPLAEQHRGIFWAANICSPFWGCFFFRVGSVMRPSRD